jgi:hypothetical protein
MASPTHDHLTASTVRLDGLHEENLTYLKKHRELFGF